MEATPKVHRHRHHRRTESRHRRPEQEPSSETTRFQDEVTVHSERIAAAEEGGWSVVYEANEVIARSTEELSQGHEHRNSSDSLEPTGCTTTSQSSQQTVVLVNGHAPPVTQELESYQQAPIKSIKDTGGTGDTGETVVVTQPPHLESPTHHTVVTGAGGGGAGGGSSRNSSGDALSLRETLQQLPPTMAASHRMRRTHSPQSPSKRTAAQDIADSSFHRGILGFMDREIKQSSPTPSALSVGGTGRKPMQSLSDPQASPAQRSLRSRSSIEKSPRRKRSKSESRRRRERKLIAAGEMEVRQANETLMRYLKQCSEMNDASLSGELEIDQSFDERRVHRKTKSQRDKRGHLISKLYTAGGLSSILKELSDDIVPAEGEEIYNPFTPVVSPTEDTPAHIDKMFLQTSSGYRPVEHCYYKHSFVGAHHGGGGGGGSGGGMDAGGVGTTAGRGMRASRGYGDTRYLLDAECGRYGVNTNTELACMVQRLWILVSNICHGLLAGLALAHLIFALTTHSTDWSMFINQLSLAGETSAKGSSDANAKLATFVQQTSSVLGDYSLFVQMYFNTFYCLAIVCLVSVLDRMDICRWDLSNATELISFRWLIIAMIYIATIVLTICSDAMDKKLFYNSNANVTVTQEDLHSNNILGIWSSLSITRSIGAICGWIMIGLTPQEDLLYEHLLDITKYQLIHN